MRLCWWVKVKGLCGSSWSRDTASFWRLTTLKSSELPVQLRNVDKLQAHFYRHLKIRFQYILITEKNTFFKYMSITEKLHPARKAKHLFYSPVAKCQALPSSSVLLSVRTVAARDPRGFMWRRVLWLPGKHTGSTLLRLR